jgi:hypothetical protein
MFVNKSFVARGALVWSLGTVNVQVLP